MGLGTARRVLRPRARGRRKFGALPRPRRLGGRGCLPPLQGRSCPGFRSRSKRITSFAHRIASLYGQPQASRGTNWEGGGRPGGWADHPLPLPAGDPTPGLSSLTRRGGHRQNSSKGPCGPTWAGGGRPHSVRSAGGNRRSARPAPELRMWGKVLDAGLGRSLTQGPWAAPWLVRALTLCPSLQDRAATRLPCCYGAARMPAAGRWDPAEAQSCGNGSAWAPPRSRLQRQVSSGPAGARPGSCPLESLSHTRNSFRGHTARAVLFIKSGCPPSLVTHRPES